VPVVGVDPSPQLDDTLVGVGGGVVLALPAGGRIVATDLAVVHVPGAVLAQGAIKDAAAAVDRCAVVTLVAGQGLLGLAPVWWTGSRSVTLRLSPPLARSLRIAPA
jgi:hypothetical protein